MPRHTTTTNLPTPPKAHKQLSELQSELLHILYKFRFANAKLISQYQEQTVRNSNVRLKNLLEQGYIGRFYDNTYRINRRSATYFLLPKAITYLKSNPDLDPKGLLLLYYNRSAKPAFISHWLRLFGLYLKFDDLCGSTLAFYTATELAEQTQFPKVSPDAYLSFSSEQITVPNFMFDLVDGNKSSEQTRQRVSRYMLHYETTNDWGSNYPPVLLVCVASWLERDVQRVLARSMDYRNAKKPAHYTATLKALFSLKDTKTAIWRSVSEPEMLLSLDDLTINH